MPVETATLDTLSLYSQIVGLGERRLPLMEEFPDTLVFDSQYLGSFFESIQATIQDRRERAQLTQWHSHTQSLGYSNVVIGSDRTISLRGEILRTYFGPKALFYYHTHPEEIPDKDGKFDPTWHKDFSLLDIAAMKAIPRLAYIAAVGSNLGGVFAFQSDESAKLPVSSVFTRLKTLFEVFILDQLKENIKVVRKYRLTDHKQTSKEQDREIMMNVADKIRVSRGGQYLENSGFGCYIWTPNAGLDENPTKIILERM